MQRIQRVSKGMAFALILALLAFVMLAAALVIFPDLFIQDMARSYNLSPDIPPLSTWQYGALAGVTVLKVLPTLYVLWKLRQMFQRFAKGEVFSAAATRHLFGAAKGMIAWGIMAILGTTAAVLILTANAPAGQHALVVNVSSTELSGVFAGVVFAVMSWVMQEAARLSEENAGFV